MGAHQKNRREYHVQETEKEKNHCTKEKSRRS